jgi:cytochrome c peroxidase
MYITDFLRKKTGFLLFLPLLAGCGREPETSVKAGPELPPHFPAPVYQAVQNPYSEAGIELGKALFHEPMLSRDGSVSCGTCHDQVHAFADHNVPLSMGVGGAIGKRNAPPVQNVIWYKHFMWDGSIRHIEVMPIAPITEPLEMAANWDTLLTRLRASEKYRNLFFKAFGSEQIDDQKMLKALAQYMATLVSAGSRYDAYVQGKGSLAPDELQGLELFRAQCASCHTEPLFTDQSFVNNGLDVVSADIGRMLITRKEEDRGSFKVPSLRNVSLTYPYMHDGRFRTLEQVLDHYTSDKSGKPLADARVRNIRLSPEEKRALIAFLRTLTDYDFVSNPKHALR